MIDSTELINKKNIFIFSLEPLETRYTSQWLYELPKLFKKYLGDSYNIVNITGNKISTTPTDGAFLNFSDTNIWKNSQINKFINLLNKKKVGNNDIVLFPDAWHTGIIQLRYLFDLLEYDIKIYSFWHAGSYDPNDFLGKKVKNKSWSFSTEAAFFNACDKNFFATNYHKELFLKTFFGKINEDNLIVSGLPFDYLETQLKKFNNPEKENLIVFPHRISSEKQLEIFKDLEKSLPEYKFIVCQEKNLTKDEYHKILGKAKIIFSANLQETLGISCYEGYLCGAVPLVPNRLSYKEMYDEKYCDDWTKDFNSYIKNKEILIKCIQLIMDNHSIFYSRFSKEKLDKFFSIKGIIKEIKNG